MVPHSLNDEYSDDGSEVLWEDGERVFRRGWRPDDNGARRAVQRMRHHLSASQCRPTRSGTAPTIYPSRAKESYPSIIARPKPAVR